MAILRLLILVACVFFSRAEAQELRTIHVAIPSVTPSVATFAVAKERGYYREEGLNVELVAMPSAVGTQALIGGNVKFSTLGGASLPPILKICPRLAQGIPHLPRQPRGVDSGLEQISPAQRRYGGKNLRSVQAGDDAGRDHQRSAATKIDRAHHRESGS